MATAPTHFESIERDPLWGEKYHPITGKVSFEEGHPKYFPVHQYQQQILDSNCRFNAAIAGTGGGKTVVGPLWCIYRIQEAIAKYGTGLGMVVAPTYKVLYRATMPCFVETLKDTALEGRYLESKSYYELPNNWGRIWAQGADNPGGLEGGQFDFVWGDEGGQFRAKTLDAITGRTGAKFAPILITTTPYAVRALFNSWIKPFRAGDKNYFILHFPSIANPAYPQEEYDRAKGSMTPEKFAERYDGMYMSLEGLVYPEFNRCKITMTKGRLADLLSSNGKFVGGIDFGWNDPFCSLGGFLTPDDILYIWFERYKSQTTLEEHAEALPKFANTDIIWYADHQPEAIRKLRRGGHVVRKATKDILGGVYAVNHRIYTGKLKVIENKCPAVCGEAEMYAYPEKDEEIIGDKPVDKDNHAMDTLRYMVMGLDRKRAA